jgi:prevent-host-death family protein
MGKKSDKRRDHRISATEASRSFSNLLDRVEKGQHFVIHRHGRDVCFMLPAPVEGRRASECLALLRGRSPVLLDDRFGKDLLEIIGTEPSEERSAWDS